MQIFYKKHKLKYGVALQLLVGFLPIETYMMLNTITKLLMCKEDRNLIFSIRLYKYVCLFLLTHVSVEVNIFVATLLPKLYQEYQLISP